MESGIGSGIMIALAAGLWLVYLVPTWLRRNEYLATERNALRLQQTLRVLAETAEIPATVRAETTARSVAEHQRALKIELAQRAAVDKARATAAARLRASEIPMPVTVPAPTLSASSSRPASSGPASDVAAPVARGPRPATTGVAPSRAVGRRIRRVRGITTIVLFLSIVAAVVQGILMAATGVAAGSFAVLGFSAVAAVTSVALLSRLASVTRARVVEPVRVAPVARRVTMSEPKAAEPTVSAKWTPVPLPKPLYLSKSNANAVGFDLAAVRAQLAEAAAFAEREQRAAAIAAVDAPGVAPLTARSTGVVPAAVSRTPSRFAAMGIVEELDSARPDLDEVLRRRRVAG